MFHLRHRKRKPKRGGVVVARCGERIVYSGTMMAAPNSECCSSCIKKGIQPHEDEWAPKYILPENPSDIKNSIMPQMWVEAR